jgi:hypothetical protein
MTGKQKSLIVSLDPCNENFKNIFSKEAGTPKVNKLFLGNKEKIFS